MTKEETVEVTIQVPKKLVDLLEAEGHFGWTREEFFVDAVKGQLGAISTAMPFDKEKEFLRKYGEDVTVYYLPEGLEDDC